MGKKKLGLLLALGLLAGAGTAISCSTPLLARAEESVITSEMTSEGEVAEQPTTEEEDESFKEMLSKYWDELIAPLFVGVTGTSVLSAILSISVAIINRKNNRISKEEVKKSHEEVSGVVALASQMIDNFQKILEAVNNQNEISKETKDSFITSSKELLEKIATLSNKTEDLMKLKKIIVTQTAIYSKIALSSKEVIASGLGEDIQALVEQIKQL